MIAPDLSFSLVEQVAQRPVPVAAQPVLDRLDGVASLEQKVNENRASDAVLQIVYVHKFR